MCEIYSNLTIKTPEQRCFGVLIVNFEQTLHIFSGVSIVRSSHRRCSIKKGVLRNFTKFKGKHLCQSLFINKNAGLRPAILLKKRLWHKCFPVNFAKFLKTSFLQNTSGRLLLHHYNWTSKCRLRNTCLGFIKTQCLWYTVFSTSDEPNN